MDAASIVRLGDFYNGKFSAGAEYRIGQVQVGADRNHEGVEDSLTIELWPRESVSAKGGWGAIPAHLHVSIPLSVWMKALGVEEWPLPSGRDLEGDSLKALLHWCDQLAKGWRGVRGEAFEGLVAAVRARNYVDPTSLSPPSIETVYEELVRRIRERQLALNGKLIALGMVTRKETNVLRWSSTWAEGWNFVMVRMPDPSTEDLVKLVRDGGHDLTEEEREVIARRLVERA